MSLFTRASAFIAATMILTYGLLTTPGHASTAWLIILVIVAGLFTLSLWTHVPRSTPTIKRTIIRGTTLFLVAFLIIGVQIARIQVVDSADISAQVASSGGNLEVQDPRIRLEASEVQRGSILTSDGKVVAETSENPDGSFLRTYPNPATAYLAGYYSPLLYGSSNLEAAYDRELMGQTGGNPITQWLDGVLHRDRRGYNINLSINDALQTQANELLGSQRGAAIVMDAKTGAIVAMASTPNFDPNKLYVNDGSQLNQETDTAKAYWDQLSAAGDSPLLLRPTQGLYIPGSIFKTVTASAAIESGVADPDTVYRDEGALTVDSRVIPEENRPDPNRVDYTLTDAYGWSLNVVFAQIGLQLGAQRMEDFAQQFGFGSAIPFDLSVVPSKLAEDPSFLTSRASQAVTAFGQGQLQVTPLEMALMADAVANGGHMMTPYLVQEITDQNGKKLSSHSNAAWKSAINADTAEKMQAIMINSVQNGYASAAQIPGYVVGGKTGTAEVGGDNKPNSWFVGFAGKDDPEYVVAVLVENGGEGSQVALPIGRQLLETALKIAPNP